MARTAPNAKRDILAAARSCFSRSGFRGTSLREIAEEYGGTKAALLYHFESKDAILEALLGPHWDALRELAHSLEGLTPAEARERAITGMADNAVRFRDDLAVFHAEIAEIMRFERFRDAGAAIDQIADAFAGGSGVLRDLIAARIVLGGVAFACHEFADAPDADLREAILLVMRHALGGIPLAETGGR